MFLKTQKKILYLENIQIVLRNIKDKIFNKYLLKFLWTDFPKFISNSIFEQNELFILLFFFSSCLVLILCELKKLIKNALQGYPLRSKIVKI